jgi:hypothetical protein
MSVLRVLVGLLIVWLLVPVASPQAGVKGSYALEQLRLERRRAAHRQRRIIFDDDGGALYEAKEPTPQAFLQARADSRAGRHVDTIFFDTVIGLGACLYPTKVGSLCTKENILGKLVAQGADPLELMVRECHAHKIEIFSNMRMDHKDCYDYLSGHGGALAEWKWEHPEWLFGRLRRDPAAAAKEFWNKPDSPEKNRVVAPYRDYVVDSNPLYPSFGGFCGADYAIPEVRNIAFRLNEEISRNYDVDGIHLDFLKHPPFFKSVAWGESVSRDETDAMTNLLRRIRGMTEELGMRRGRPILVSVRIFESLPLNLNQGLDVERWLKDDLIDLVTVGAVEAAPFEEMITVGHRYDKPVYPCLHRTGKNGLAGQRARAQAAWNSGADGIYMFNYFGPQWTPLLSELGDPHLLQHMDKIYATSPMVMLAAGTAYSDTLARLLAMPTLNPKNPELLQPGQVYLVAHFPVGDDLLGSQGEGLVPEVRVRVQVKDLASASQLHVLMNDQWLSGASLSGEWLEFQPMPKLVRRGNNRFELELAKEHTGPVVLRDLQLHIRYKKTL